MDNAFIFRHVDHTLLRPTATWSEIRTLCEEAIAYSMASVCVPPCYVRRIVDAYGEALPVCTVIGFPLGYDTTAAKCAAAEDAIRAGAREIDMVVNLADVKNGAFCAITNEIAALKSVAKGNLLKVIVETCYLTEEEKIALCGCVTEGGADFIKTSTGFGSAGAALPDIALFLRHIGKDVRIKAAGGIRTRADMVGYLEAGCARIGTSGAVKALV